MSKKQVNLLYIEDTEIDKAVLDAVVETVQDDCPGKKIKIETKSLMYEIGTRNSNMQILRESIRNADIIVFDYGGFRMFLSPGYKLIDYWNRFFIKCIEDTPSKDWRCMSALNTFESEDAELLKGLGVQFKYV